MWNMNNVGNLNDFTLYWIKLFCRNNDGEKSNKNPNKMFMCRYSCIFICQVENQSKINNHGNIKNPQTTDLNLTKTCRGKSKHARHYRTNNITFIVYYYSEEGSAYIEWWVIIQHDCEKWGEGFVKWFLWVGYDWREQFKIHMKKMPYYCLEIVGEKYVICVLIN